VVALEMPLSQGSGWIDGTEPWKLPVRFATVAAPEPSNALPNLPASFGITTFTVASLTSARASARVLTSGSRLATLSALTAVLYSPETGATLSSMLSDVAPHRSLASVVGSPDGGGGGSWTGGNGRWTPSKFSTTPPCGPGVVVPHRQGFVAAARSSLLPAASCCGTPSPVTMSEIVSGSPFAP